MRANRVKKQAIIAKCFNMKIYRFKISFANGEYFFEDLPAIDPEAAYEYMYEEYPDAQIECTDVIEE